MAQRWPCIAVATLCYVLALAMSGSAESEKCEWRFNVGDHLLARKDGEDLGVIVRRDEKHRFLSGAVGCAYILRKHYPRGSVDDARVPRILHEIAKVGMPPAPPDCKWRFNVGDLLVFTKDGSELGVVVHREPRYRFPNGVVGCAYFIQADAETVQKFPAPTLERIGTRP